MIRKTAARVVSVAALPAPGHHVLTFEAPELARDARAGHFISVSADTGPSILRKPFSVFTVDPDSGVCSILFSVYGPTTRAMARMQPGDTLDFIGPLGGRVFLPASGTDRHHILVGGGYGVPPLNFLARTLRREHPGARVTLVHGARTANLLVGADGLSELGVDVVACTDDGSAGIHGRVTVALEPMLASGASVYTCGPTPMMRAVAERCLENGVPCQISMETPMPCGVGICVGCVVGKTDGTYSRTCVDGPVYSAGEVRW
ncbi:MAG: dihydroorotate dehydrogenase electron transfer subunit [Armatimonadota bacterium]